MNKVYWFTIQQIQSHFKRLQNNNPVSISKQKAATEQSSAEQTSKLTTLTKLSHINISSLCNIILR